MCKDDCEKCIGTKVDTDKTLEGTVWESMKKYLVSVYINWRGILKQYTISLIVA